MPGPKGVLQEKYQRTLIDPQNDGENQWANKSFGDTTHIRKIYKPSRPEYYENPETLFPGGQTGFSDPKFNYMPPGMFIDNQEPMVTERKYEYVAAGETDVTKDTTVSSMKYGFRRQNMTPVDDMYNNEHVEEFYGEARGTDDKDQEYIGFVERSNYLDRN